jgi:hypothetical protein
MSEGGRGPEIPDEAIEENRLRDDFAEADRHWREQARVHEEPEHQSDEALAREQELFAERNAILDRLQAIGVDPTLIPVRSDDDIANRESEVLDEDEAGLTAILEELDPDPNPSD